MEPVFVYRYRVTSADIDELGHAGNFHYIRWLQHAAVAHSTALGWPSARYRALGAGWVVRSHQITYLKPAFEGDEVLVRTWVANMRPATSLRCYEIHNSEGDLLAEATTDWAFINYQKQRPVRIPAEVADSFPVLETPVRAES
jgi:acyl-CoA thioester hydrolase